MADARQRDLVRYFALAYIIAWGGVGAVAASGAETVWLYPPMLAAPPVAAIMLSYRDGGWSAVAALFQRLSGWRAAWGWYLVALGLAPLVILTALKCAEWIAGADYRPGFAPALLTIGVAAGLAEEIGWTGYATPRLLVGRDWWAAGFLLGVIWALWHVAADLTGNLAAMGRVWPLWFGVFWLATLPPYRMLMTWVQSCTGVLPLAVLMHAS